ncbi:nicotinamidase-related amidase [Actinoplanes tereljensis]|uniref:Cysteine hydrolase n=1 Tax=Paractinoplanes tereljensis TaxID=571912 RepID=A0A919NTN6_9ACTN|nr:isochorismatase family cysteine hydrolase [Actinoplanes tereljensis]GIF24060.1 cysteine hydrolase [Actinoplanes tereljensis]
MSSTALLVMDVQNAVVHRYPDPDYLPRLASAIATARAAGVPVIYVGVGFRPGFPEVSPRNKMFGPMAGRAGGGNDDQAMAIHADVAPADGDAIVTKRRVSAFAGSDLDVLLRAREIDHLVLTGIATSGVVLSTLRQAADLDFRLTVLSDGCLDADPEVHRVLVEKVFPAQADVHTIAEWEPKVSNG